MAAGLADVHCIIKCGLRQVAGRDGNRDGNRGANRGADRAGGIDRTTAGEPLRLRKASASMPALATASWPAEIAGLGEGEVS
jgi:hypothetical protein